MLTIVREIVCFLFWFIESYIQPNLICRWPCI